MFKEFTNAIKKLGKYLHKSNSEGSARVYGFDDIGQGIGSVSNFASDYPSNLYGSSHGFPMTDEDKKVSEHNLDKLKKYMSNKIMGLRNYVTRFKDRIRSKDIEQNKSYAIPLHFASTDNEDEIGYNILKGLIGVGGAGTAAGAYGVISTIGTAALGASTFGLGIPVAATLFFIVYYKALRNSERRARQKLQEEAEMYRKALEEAQKIKLKKPYVFRWREDETEQQKEIYSGKELEELVKEWTLTGAASLSLLYEELPKLSPEFQARSGLNLKEIYEKFYTNFIKSYNEISAKKRETAQRVEKLTREIEEGEKRLSELDLEYLREQLETEKISIEEYQKRITERMELEARTSLLRREMVETRREYENLQTINQRLDSLKAKIEEDREAAEVKRRLAKYRPEEFRNDDPDCALIAEFQLNNPGLEKESFEEKPISFKAYLRRKENRENANKIRDLINIYKNSEGLSWLQIQTKILDEYGVKVSRTTIYKWSSRKKDLQKVKFHVREF